MKITPRTRLIFERTYPALTPPTSQPRLVGGVLIVTDTGDKISLGDGDAKFEITKDEAGNLVFRVYNKSI